MKSMKKVRLRMNEEEKYNIIKELVDHGGNKSRAALKLGLCVRQVNRLIIVYKEKGKAGFVHGNRNRQPINTTPQDLSDKILHLYKTKYQGCNFNHFKDLLKESENITVSYNFLYTLLMENGITSPKIQKSTRKNIKKKQLKQSNPEYSEKDIEDISKHEIEMEDAHPRKERCKYFGEEVQMDASIHRWFGDSKCALHLAIDNATGNILGAYFAAQETLYGYYMVFWQILTKYGIPYLFFTDNRTVFYYESKNKKDDDKDVLTQFGYACRTLGTIIKTSSVSQAKGQIERANGTFQGRLVQELRINGIITMEEANKYLIETFVPSFNKKFAEDFSLYDSVFEKAPDEKEINLILAVLSPRQFDSGSSIKYHNKFFKAYDEDENLICFKPKTKCLVIKALDKSLFVTVDDKVYALKEHKKNKDESENFDDVKVKETKKTYIPPMNHPWRRDMFLKQQERAHEFHQYT